MDQLITHFFENEIEESAKSSQVAEHWFEPCLKCEASDLFVFQPYTFLVPRIKYLLHLLLCQED